MSIDKNYYVIAGFDLTGYKTGKYEDWRWTEEGEEFTCYQRKDYIQLFDDPMSDKHLYLGYVLASGDEYEFKTAKTNMHDFLEVEPTVWHKLKHLVDIGVIHEAILISKELRYEMIIFEECT